MQNTTKLTALFAAVVGIGAFVGSAQAALITIGASIDNGPITTEAGPSAGNAVVGFTIGAYNVNNVSGTGLPVLTLPSLLNSNSINASTTGTNTVLHVFVTESGITSATGLQTFISSLTENTITSGWSATLATFLDAANGTFALTTPLNSATFNAIGTSVLNHLANAGAGPYSVTAEYTISSNSIGGSANSTINMSVVPEPASLTIFGTALLGLGGLGALRRRRRRNA